MRPKLFVGPFDMRRGFATPKISLVKTERGKQDCARRLPTLGWELKARTKPFVPLSPTVSGRLQKQTGSLTIPRLSPLPP
jgi:hypothetical protein